ncbi:conserved hypothetical protein [Histoplasma capsulatum H143]|uniref:Uncharacterized protein n=1 Tax=Ajellomyces capsulatus (strain H143) TaxID=544712 RepID=C6HG47_AJECH|nr:conserved hypothetical protein [Histoplasma capsulatum H143]
MAFSEQRKDWDPPTQRVQAQRCITPSPGALKISTLGDQFWARPSLGVAELLQTEGLISASTRALKDWVARHKTNYRIISRLVVPFRAGVVAPQPAWDIETTTWSRISSGELTRMWHEQESGETHQRWAYGERVSAPEPTIGRRVVQLWELVRPLLRALLSFEGGDPL